MPPLPYVLALRLQLPCVCRCAMPVLPTGWDNVEPDAEPMGCHGLLTSAPPPRAEPGCGKTYASQQDFESHQEQHLRRAQRAERCAARSGLTCKLATSLRPVPAPAACVLRLCVVVPRWGRGLEAQLEIVKAKLEKERAKSKEMLISFCKETIRAGTMSAIQPDTEHAAVAPKGATHYFIPSQSFVQPEGGHFQVCSCCAVCTCSDPAHSTRPQLPFQEPVAPAMNGVLAVQVICRTEKLNYFRHKLARIEGNWGLASLSDDPDAKKFTGVRNEMKRSVAAVRTLLRLRLAHASWPTVSICGQLIEKDSRVILGDRRSRRRAGRKRRHALCEGVAQAEAVRGQRHEAATEGGEAGCQEARERGEEGRETSQKAEGRAPSRPGAGRSAENIGQEGGPAAEED